MTASLAFSGLTVPLTRRFTIRDYGFILSTLAEDNDPLDVLALVGDPSFTGCLIPVRPVGVLNMVDSEEKWIRKYWRSEE